MNDLFTGEVKSLLKAAYNLHEAGEKNIAKEMCVKCVKDVAKHNKVDVLAYFYGDKIYNKMSSPEDAIRYIYIAKCAIEGYDAIEPLGPAKGTNKPWATISNSTSDPQMIEFFKWVRDSEKELTDDDAKYFEILIKAAKNRNKIQFKLAEKLKGVRLVDIIPLVVNKMRMIAEDGELR